VEPFLEDAGWDAARQAATGDGREDEPGGKPRRQHAVRPVIRALRVVQVSSSLIA
jgi:hypothetical protein